MAQSYKYLIAILCGVLIGAAGFWLWNRYQRIIGGDKMDQVLQLIDEYYVDSVDIAEIRTNTIPFLLGALDPHSTYIPPLESEMETQRLEGQFEGIGIIYNIMTDTIVVDQVFAGGPSELAGLKPGDRILSCNDHSLLGNEQLHPLPQDSISNILRGLQGSVAALHILRSGMPLEINVVRGSVPIKSIDAAFMINASTGLIRINTWARTTHDEFIQAIGRLQAEGAQALIIDLRDNVGGYMASAIAIANEFLEEGQLIVYTEGRTMPREDVVANGEGMLRSMPLVVVVNEHTASSSEIFAGAMQDHDRATIIGRQTYGKGLVQQPFFFDDKSCVRLTVARYYTPSGRNIQRPYEQGSLSSIEESLAMVSEIKPLGDRVDTLSLVKPKTYRSDKGRLLYSGYGIMPDIFVPRDTSLINAYAARLIMSGAMQEYAFYYVDSNRELLGAYKDISSLQEFLSTDTRLLDDLAYYASERAGLAQRPSMLRQASQRLTLQMHALIVNNIFGATGFYQVMSQDDPMIARATQTIDKK